MMEEFRREFKMEGFRGNLKNKSSHKKTGKPVIIFPAQIFK